MLFRMALRRHNTVLCHLQVLFNKLTLITFIIGFVVLSVSIVESDYANVKPRTSVYDILPKGILKTRVLDCMN
jgi:hypothetical protein